MRLAIRNRAVIMSIYTLRDIYEQSVANYASRPAFSMYGGETLTYREFAQRVQQVVELFREAGLVSGDKVALLSNSMPNWPVCYFAIVTSGLVAVPILPDFSTPELDMIIGHSGAKALCCSDKLFTKISKSTIDKLELVVRTMNLGVICSGKEPQTGNLTVPKADDVAVIIYTSGTTSEPKGVMLTHANLVSQVEMDYDLFHVYESDVFLSILPLSHTYECSLGMLLPFYSGASVVYLDKLPTASTLMPAMRKVRPTVMLSVPLIIEKIYKSQVKAKFTKKPALKKMYGWPWFRKVVHRMAGKKLREVFGGRLRFFGIGGAKLDFDTEQFLAEARFPYGVGYGLTETAPLLAGGIPGKIRFRSTGPILNRVEARLENVNPQTGEGEIVVLSPSTMKGYYKNPTATEDVFTPDGWFRTKDIGRFDEQGNLYILGRVGNMIVGPSGENIYPEEIESVINSHFLVTDSIVKENDGKLVAQVHFNRDELERRYYDLKDSLNARMAEISNEIKAYVNSKVSKSAQISDIEEQHKEFEKTPTQKIKRFKYAGPKVSSGKKPAEGEQ